MNSGWILIGIIGVVIVAIGGFFVMNMNKSTTTNSNETINSAVTPASESATTPSAMSENEITVEAGEFQFTPSEITVKKGEKVKITFKNAGKFPHNFTIADLSIATKRINPGQEDTVEFTANKTGEFKFFCSVGNHQEQGMVGTLTVE
ncbi:MAG: cupredoxin domain-containing protein [Patescibacteria group bacterium]